MSIKLHNGKPADNATMREIRRSIKWYETKLATPELKEASYMKDMFISFNNSYQELREYYAKRLQKQK